MGHQPTQGWSATRRKCTTDMEFATYLTKLTSGYNCLSSLDWSPTNPRMVTHHSKSIRRKCITDLKLGLNSLLKLSPVEIPWMVNHHPQDGHQPSKGWSPTIQNLPEGSVLQTWNFAIRLSSQNKCQVRPAMDGHPPN